MDPRIFTEATKTASVSYPIPFILVTLLAFCLCCFGGAAFVSGVLLWVLIVAGCVTGLTGVALIVYAVFRRPELLRSERHSLAERYLDWANDPYLDDATRETAGKVILGLSHDMPKRMSGDPDDDRAGDEE